MLRRDAHYILYPCHTVFQLDPPMGHDPVAASGDVRIADNPYKSEPRPGTSRRQAILPDLHIELPSVYLGE